MSGLFGSEFLRRLERIRSHALKGRAARAGDKPSHETAEGVEFQDYRGYAPGDDLRDVDWNAFARLGRLFRKRYRKEEGEGLALVLDLSASMALGDPSKERQARLLAGGLGALALASGSRVQLFLAGASLERESFEGKSAVPGFLARLEAARAGGGRETFFRLWEQTEDFGRGVEIFAITDALFPEGPDRFLEILARWSRRGHEIRFLQVLAPQDRDPFSEDPAGTVWRCVDSETGEALDWESSAASSAQLRGALDEMQRGLEAFSRRHGVGFFAADSQEPFDEPLLRVFAEEGS